MRPAARKPFSPQHLWPAMMTTCTAVCKGKDGGEGKGREGRGGEGRGGEGRGGEGRGGEGRGGEGRGGEH